MVRALMGKFCAAIRPESQHKTSPLPSSAVTARAVGVRAGAQQVLQEVSLQVPQGSWLALVGPNGAGKSTLLRTLAGLGAHTGSVEIFGATTGVLSLRARAHQLAYVPQRPTLIESMSVADYVLLGRTPHFAVAGWARRNDRLEVAALLQQLGLAAFAARRLGSLSGGEQQRVVLAHALAGRAQVLLLDEPTCALDIGQAGAALELLDQLRRRLGLTVISALHELNQAAAFSTEVALLHQGRLRAHGSPADVFTATRLQQVYGARVEVSQHHGRPRISMLR